MRANEPACSQIWARVIQGWRGPCLGALLCSEEATSDRACSTRLAAMDVACTEPGSKEWHCNICPIPYIQCVRWTRSTKGSSRAQQEEAPEPTSLHTLQHSVIALDEVKINTHAETATLCSLVMKRSITSTALFELNLIITGLQKWDNLWKQHVTRWRSDITNESATSEVSADE